MVSMVEDWTGCAAVRLCCGCLLFCKKKTLCAGQEQFKEKVFARVKNNRYATHLTTPETATVMTTTPAESSTVTTVRSAARKNAIADTTRRVQDLISKYHAPAGMAAMAGHDPAVHHDSTPLGCALRTHANSVRAAGIVAISLAMVSTALFVAQPPIVMVAVTNDLDRTAVVDPTLLLKWTVSIAVPVAVLACHVAHTR
jgi:hypothetical protein